MDNQLTIIEQAKKGLAELTALKSQLDAIGLNCQKIAITDELTLSVAQNNLSKANNMLKLLEDKRKAVKAPYKEAGELVDDTAKLLSEELTKGIKHLKSGVAAWEEDRKKKLQEKQAEITAKLEVNQITPEAAAEQSKSLVESASISTTKNIRYTWAFELSDIKQVPVEWLTLDEEKVKEWMKQNKDSLKEETKNEVKFFKKTIVVA